jgi:hypothetical protein
MLHPSTRAPTALLLTAIALSGCRCQQDAINELRKPTLVADPARVDFGDVPVGVVATRDVAASNTGEQVLRIDAARVEGDAAFTASGVPATVQPLERGVVRVSFAPQRAGAAAGTLVLQGNAESGETRIPLSGNGVGGVVCGDCNSPPPPRCLTPTELLVYDPAGTCDNGQCRYVARNIPCAGACVTSSCEPPPDAGTPGDAAVPDAATMPPPDAGPSPADAGPPGDAGNPFTGPCGPPDIQPYFTGGTFGGFQSVPGSGYQQTIVITFNCPVNRVTVTIQDPDFPGNRLQAFHQGALVDEQAFVGDGMPGVLTQDTQTVGAPTIDEVHLVPDPVDYVAYLLVSYEVP